MGQKILDLQTANDQLSLRVTELEDKIEELENVNIEFLQNPIEPAKPMTP